MSNASGEKKLRYYTFLVTIIFFIISCSPKQSENDANDKGSVSQKPNIIIVLTDDQGYKDVGFNGSQDILTPNIDRIAQNGVVFTNGYVSYAVCGPSRAGLITGRYQDRFGFSRNPLFAPKDSTQGLPLSEETMATALKRGGYQTMAIGKWHLGAHPSQRPLQRGFDEFFGFLTGGHRYFKEEWIRKDLSEVESQFDAYRTKLLRNDERIEETEYLTDALSREAVDFVDRNGDNPFFLYLAYNAPHTPLQATEKYLKRYADIEDEKRRTYSAMVSAVDDGVGSLLNKLEEKGIADNTIVFFLSDNGGPEKKNKSDNGVLRDGKGSMYEGGIRVPFAVQWTGIIPSGITYDHPVISLDMFATAVAQAGISPKNPLDGVDLVPYLKGDVTTAPHEALFWRQYDLNGLAVRSGNMKLTKDRNGEKELYDLSLDISEANPLSDQINFDQLQQLHDAWDSKNVEPAFLGLRQNDQYNSLNPDRFTDGEKY